jgi:tetratricopeptide (TPR) repeat protein
MSMANKWAMMALLSGAVACGGGAAKGGKGAKSPENPGSAKTHSGAQVDAGAQSTFEGALTRFAEIDKSGNWEESCEGLAKDFLAAADQQKKATNAVFAEALYNAGLAYQRCNRDSDAQKYFNEAVGANANMHRARAQLVLYEYAKNGDLEGTIRKLDQIIRDAKFQNGEALVYLAALQMERGSDQSDQDGKDDYERAKKNIQRALAIDDGFMPAFNQLAVYYLEEAKRKADKSAAKRASSGKRAKRRLEVAGAKKSYANQQQLDLAALVASQAIRKNPNYAPIYNTAGLIQVELQNYNGAVGSFRKARSLDPRFFEAHMNYGAVNLSFRGFSEAEKAYRDAIRLRPKEYEAHLGLALAIRGQITDANSAEYIQKAQASLDECKKIDPARPETYYNEAILTQEYKAKSEKAVAMLEAAAKLYREFISKAGGDPVFEEAVKRAKDRSEDIEQTVKFIKEGEAAASAEASAKK